MTRLGIQLGLWLAPTGSRRRWWVAELLNRRTVACWSDLVDWLMLPPNWRAEEREDTLRQSLAGGRQCKLEATGPMAHTCYCGKWMAAVDRAAVDAYRAKQAEQGDDR